MARIPKKSASDVLVQAVEDPSDANIERAITHPELKRSLSKLSTDEFKKISDTITAYLVLRDALHSGTASTTGMAASHPDLTSVLKKVGPEGLRDLAKATEGPEARKGACTVVRF